MGIAALSSAYKLIVYGVIYGVQLMHTISLRLSQKLFVELRLVQEESRLTTSSSSAGAVCITIEV